MRRAGESVAEFVRILTSEAREKAVRTLTISATNYSSPVISSGRRETLSKIPIESNDAHSELPP